jgi:hypothetical protein
MTTDAGGLLVREVDRRLHLTDRLAACFRDHRRRDKIEHTVRELAAQRVYGLVLGYEGLNDHDQLRADPLLAVLVGKAEPEGDRTASRAGPRQAGRRQEQSPVGLPFQGPFRLPVQLLREVATHPHGEHVMKLRLPACCNLDARYSASTASATGLTDRTDIEPRNGRI